MKVISIGTKFHYTHADGNPEWTVTQNRGRGMWIATIKDNVDWQGTTKAFSSREIQQSLAMAAMWEQSANESDRFFNGLAVDSIVHYSNGRNSYVRCKVSPTHQLIPIALVGDWQAYDLPQRRIDGSIYNGYHVQNLIDQKPFRPHASNVWEYNVTKTPNSQPIGFNRWKDPRNMTPVDYSVPPMTPEQEATAKVQQKLDSISDILRNGELKPEGKLSMIENLLDDNAL